jgi:hypothetical protein
MGTRLSDVRVRLAGTVVIAAALLVTASCGTATQARPATGTPAASSTTVVAAQARSSCRAFSLSLVSDHGGQPSPVAAAVWFTGHGGVGDLPRSGWHQDGQDESGVIVRSGDVALHVLQGSDRTWQVDSGSWC